MKNSPINSLKSLIIFLQVKDNYSEKEQKMILKSFRSTSKSFFNQSRESGK